MKIIQQTIWHSGKWLNFHKAQFECDGKLGDWEYVSRPRRNGPADGVGILATVKENGEDKIITIASFRIPINQWVLEFPGGIIEKNEEDPRLAAIRELKEETGYQADLADGCSIGKISYNDPWKSNECNLLVRLKVDLGKEENSKPVQNLDVGEAIKVELIPVKGMLAYLDVLCQEKNYALDSRVYTFAIGAEMGRGETNNNNSN